MSFGEEERAGEEVADFRFDLRGAAQFGAVAGPIKVAAVTPLFWVVKILTTGMGETTSDFFVRLFDPYLVVLVGAVLFLAAIALQLRQRRYVVWIYWLAVVMVSVFGTMAADVLHVGLGIPYAVSSAFFAVALAVVFAAWFSAEHTLSIHSITTMRRELFYWATVVTTFALGTAVGDLTATSLHLGYLTSGVLFAVIFVLPALAYWRLGLNSIAAFWFAYILTRPLGASFADWMGVSHARGGLAWGTGPVSLVLALIIVVIVSYMAMTRADAGEVEPAVASK